MTNMTQFIDYCMDFYGPNGVYKLNFTRDQIRLATDLYLLSDREFVGDSIDRENVRDIVLQATGKEFV